MIVAFLNEKGGVGKTTLVTNLARGYQREDKKVLLGEHKNPGEMAVAVDRVP
jgi:Mrp family chromosome partitioning ATPase